MYLKKLELFGFKSFADKTVLNFGPGITAVVGPNGCGKSNIFDAIRWVLGEQSIKALRGASMADVIFNGTAQKPALGFAEVSLTFDNQSKALPVEYNEVTVSRRLFRSGESQYLLNKTPVRLKDITGLFLGTGVGSDAYSFVQQGRIDLIVSAKPEDRRQLFDEAAGITKYKAKKKEALSKLQSTDNNLLRINDIVTEVKRQIASIERQAKKATRYKREYDRLKKLEVRFAHYEIGQVAGRKNEIEQFLKDSQEQMTQAAERINRLKEMLNEENHSLEDLDKKIQNIRAEEIKLGNDIDISQKQIGFNQERIEGLAQEAKRAEEQKEQFLERCRVQQQKIEELTQMTAALETQLNESLATLKDKRTELSSVANAIQDAQEVIRQDEEKVLNISTEQVRIKNELTEVMKECQHALARQKRLEVETEKVRTEQQQVEHKLSAVEQQITQTRTKVAGLRLEHEQQTEQRNEKQIKLKELEENINLLEKRRLALISQKDFIEKLHVQYKDIPDPVSEGKFLTSTPPQDHHTGIIGKVKEVKTTGANKGKIWSILFGAKQDKELYEIICETKFIELDPQQIKKKIEDMTVQIEQLSEEKTQLVAVIQGIEEQLQALQDDIHAQEKALSISQSQQDDIKSELNKLKDELEILKSEEEEVEGILSDVQVKEDNLNQQLDRTNQEIEFNQEEIKQKRTFIGDRNIVREEITVRIAQLETEVQSIQDKQKSEQENVRLFQANIDESLAEINRIDGRIKENVSKEDQYRNEIVELDQTIKNVELQKETLAGELKNYEALKDDNVKGLDKIREDIQGLESDIEVLKEKTHEKELKNQEIAYSEKSVKDRLMQTYKIDLDTFKFEDDEPQEESKEGEEKEGEGQEGQEGEEPKEQAKEEVEEILPGVPQPVSRKKLPDVMSIPEEELAQEVELLKKRCESYGSVNLVAIDEYSELKQRFEFLAKQQSDLIESRESLMKTIQKINRTTKQMFTETFHKVNEEFRVYFRMLFGGGEAELILIDPENPLESGIEIVARPPGKKLQSISLMSGGEKTLTAIGLIFGVFKVKPSPFCVLDEIDAALDESNVGRIGYLLKDFAKIAQFIVVTHNKKTLENADVMYGITMPESGVSKIVSVKMTDDDQTPKKAATPEPEPALA